jgi:hypothetical protein
VESDAAAIMSTQLSAMKANIFFAVGLLLCCLLIGCGAQMRTMPVGAQRMQANASIGGPMVNAFGTTIPIPYGIVGATYGVSNSTEVFLDFHATAAAFKFLGITPGVVYFPRLHGGRMVPAIGADALIFSDFNASRLYPELVTSVAYRLSKRWIPYAALRHTFQTAHTPHYIPSAMAGTALRSGNMQYFVELQWLTLDRDNRWNPVDYHGVSHRGALSLQFGAVYDLPTGKGAAK